MKGMGPNPEVTYPASYEHPGARQFSYDPDLAKYLESHNMDRYPLNITNEQNANIDCVTIEPKTSQNETLDFGKGCLSRGETSAKNVSLALNSEPVTIPGICDEGKDTSAANTFLGDETMSNLKLFDIPLLGKTLTNEKKLLIRECSFKSEEEIKKWESLMQYPSDCSMSKELKDVSLLKFANPGASGNGNSYLQEEKTHYHVQNNDEDKSRKNSREGGCEKAIGFPNKTFGESSLISYGKIGGGSSTGIFVNKKDVTTKEISSVPKALGTINKVEKKKINESLELSKKSHEDVRKGGLLLIPCQKRVESSSITQEEAKEKPNLCRDKKQNESSAISGKSGEVNFRKSNKDVIKSNHSRQFGVESYLPSLKPNVVKIPIGFRKKLTENVNINKKVRSLSESSCSSEMLKIEKFGSELCSKQCQVFKKEETMKTFEKKLKVAKVYKGENSKSSHINLVSKTFLSAGQSPKIGKTRCEKIKQDLSIGKKTEGKELDNKSGGSHGKKHSDRKIVEGKKGKGEKNRTPVTVNGKDHETIHSKVNNSESEKKRRGRGACNMSTEAGCAEMGVEGKDEKFGNMIFPWQESTEEVLTNECGELYLMQDEYIEDVLVSVKSDLNNEEQKEGFALSDNEVENTLEEWTFPTKEELLFQNRLTLPKTLDGHYKVPEYMNPVVVTDKLYVIPGCFRYSPGLIDMVLAKTMKYKERYLRKLARREEGRKSLETLSYDSHSVESSLMTGQQVPAAKDQSLKEKSELVLHNLNDGGEVVTKDENKKEENIEKNEVDMSNVNMNFESASKRFFSLQIDDFERRFLLPKPE